MKKVVLLLAVLAMLYGCAGMGPQGAYSMPLANAISVAADMATVNVKSDHGRSSISSFAGGIRLDAVGMQQGAYFTPQPRACWYPEYNQQMRCNPYGCWYVPVVVPRYYTCY